MKQGRKKMFSQRPFSQRKQMSDIKLQQQPNYIPVVLQSGKSSAVPTQKRYTIQKKLKILDVVSIFQKQKNIDKEQKGFYLFATQRKQILKNNQIIQDIYNKHKESDGWLYLQYDTSQVF